MNDIADEIIRGIKLDIMETFSTVHNYIDLDAMILRKGAVSAQAGEKLITPHEHAGWLPALPGQGQRGLELLCPSRCRPSDEPGGGKAVLHSVPVQKRDAGHLYNFRQPGDAG